LTPEAPNEPLPEPNPAEPELPWTDLTWAALPLNLEFWAPGPNPELPNDDREPAKCDELSNPLLPKPLSTKPLREVNPDPDPDEWLLLNPAPEPEE